MLNIEPSGHRAPRGADAPEPLAPAEVVGATSSIASTPPSAQEAPNAIEPELPPVMTRSLPSTEAAQRGAAVRQVAVRAGDGARFDAIALLRSLATMRAEGELTPAMEAKLAEIQKKLDRMTRELDAAPSTTEKARIIARALAHVGAPIPATHRAPDAGQRAVVMTAVGLLAALAARTAISVHTLPQALALAAGALLGGVTGNKLSAVVHHALDNYGFDRAPPLADVAREFQAHHAEPMHVTRETWALTAFAASQAVAVLVGAVLLADPGIGASAFAATIALGALMAQENHKAAHRPSAEVPILYDVAQLLGLSITKEDHARHHQGPHGDHYAVISGTDGDDGAAFRRWEALIYRLTGVEPNAWKLDPKLKLEALGAAGFDPQADAALALRNAELGELRARKRDQDDRLAKGGTLGEGEARVTHEALRAKAEEIPDRRRVAPADFDGARSLFDLRPFVR